MKATLVKRLGAVPGTVLGVMAVSLLALWLVAEVGVAGPAIAAPDGAKAVPLRSVGVVPGQYIVVFKDDVANPRAAAGRLARTHGFAPKFIYSVALKGFSATLSPRAAAALSRNPRVAYIEADQWVQAFGHTGVATPTGIHRIFAPDNSNITIDGSDDLRIDVDVAVIDTGIDGSHPDLNVVAAPTAPRAALSTIPAPTTTATTATATAPTSPAPSAASTTAAARSVSPPARGCTRSRF